MQKQARARPFVIRPLEITCGSEKACLGRGFPQLNAPTTGIDGRTGAAYSVGSPVLRGVPMSAPARRKAGMSTEDQAAYLGVESSARGYQWRERLAPGQRKTMADVGRER